MGSGWHPAFRHVDNWIELSGRDRTCPRLSADPRPGMPQRSNYPYEAPQGIRGRYPRVSSPSVLGG